MDIHLVQPFPHASNAGPSQRIGDSERLADRFFVVWNCTRSRQIEESSFYFRSQEVRPDRIREIARVEQDDSDFLRKMGDIQERARRNFARTYVLHLKTL